jgi:hypothetical protein
MHVYVGRQCENCAVTYAWHGVQIIAAAPLAMTPPMECGTAAATPQILENVWRLAGQGSAGLRLPIAMLAAGRIGAGRVSQVRCTQEWYGTTFALHVPPPPKHA